MKAIEFNQVIRTEDDLRAVIGHPSYRVVDKAITELDDLCEAFIAKSPFIMISSADADGNADNSPKGDPPGFVQVLNSKTLLIPDRPGNRRADTLVNIIQNPNIGMFFLVPGKSETLRVNGKAQIVLDESIRQRFVIKGKAPVVVIAVTVEEAFFHCAKCIIRSQLWQTDAHAELDGLPTLAEAMVKHGKLEDTSEEMQAMIEDDAQNRLY